MKILVINTGSSSIKYKLYDMESQRVLTAGVLEKIGEESSHIKHQFFPAASQQKVKEENKAISDHREGLRRISELLQDEEYGAISNTSEIKAVGHRVVHGGEKFSDATLISDEVKQTIEALIPLAPLHNPPNLQGIAVAEEVFPQAKQVAVFDTAFHQSMPPHAYRYAIPDELYRDKQLRAYGMHGTSHQYVAQQAALHCGKLMSDFNGITVHLGNGCSMTAVKNGKSIDTSMGISPLPGLIMGTRSGDIDPAIIFYLGREMKMSFDEIDQLLNKKSGLKGIAGDNDLRSVTSKMEEGDQRAQLALAMYTYRIKKYIGAYMAVCGPLDALVFTAGVGENSAYVREKSCEGLQHIGISLDKGKNQQKKEGIKEIHADDSRCQILVIPTDEEKAIAEQTFTLLNQ
ncbi:MAG: acetate/propionate family kinase [Cyclobacteriaceae bacterium]